MFRSTLQIINQQYEQQPTWVDLILIKVRSFTPKGSTRIELGNAIYPNSHPSSPYPQLHFPILQQNKQQQ